MLLIPAHPDSCAGFLTFLHRRTRWERGEELLPQIRASFKKKLDKTAQYVWAVCLRSFMALPKIVFWWRKNSSKSKILPMRLRFSHDFLRFSLSESFTQYVWYK